MTDWPSDRDDGSDTERIALDSEGDSDLDEALREAVDAVEAAGKRGNGPNRPESGLDSALIETADEAETEELDGVAMLRAELEELRERSTRTLADFDNYRKRVEREKQARQRYNGMEVLRGLLDIIDNLERALDAGGSVDDLKAGVELTLRQAEGLLKHHGVSRIEAGGAPFDPSVHEAVTRHEHEEVGEPTVTDVLQSGYQMYDRLLRPARVAVAVPPASDPAGSDADEATDGDEER